MIDGSVRLDLDYVLDVAADVDMNIVMTGSGRFVEIQGTGEEATFGDEDLTALLSLGRKGIGELKQIQREALGEATGAASAGAVVTSVLLLAGPLLADQCAPCFG